MLNAVDVVVFSFFNFLFKDVVAAVILASIEMSHVAVRGVRGRSPLVKIFEKGWGASLFVVI